MAHYRDIITYTLADGITEDFLQEQCASIYESWMQHQDGFVSWVLHKNKDGSYTDIVTYVSEAAAQKANESYTKDVPQDHPWMTCYDMTSITTKKSTEVLAFGG